MFHQAKELEEAGGWVERGEGGGGGCMVRILFGDLWVVVGVMRVRACREEEL